jgi:hypothetical protein
LTLAASYGIDINLLGDPTSLEAVSLTVQPTAKKVIAPADPLESDPIKEVFDHYTKVWASHFSKLRLTDKKRSTLNARLQHFSVDELKNVIDYTYASDWNRGENSRNWVADFDYHFRNDDQTEKLLNRKPKSDKPPVTTGYKSIEEGQLF